MSNDEAIEEETYRHHGKEITANPKKEAQPVEEEEWWDCPICGRPQSADERQFNEHIDLCLSRQTIRDAVQEDAGDKEKKVGNSVPPETKRAKFGEKKKAKKAERDGKQTKLMFG